MVNLSETLSGRMHFPWSKHEVLTPEKIALQKSREILIKRIESIRGRSKSGQSVELFVEKDAKRQYSSLDDGSRVRQLIPSEDFLSMAYGVLDEMGRDEHRSVSGPIERSGSNTFQKQVHPNIKNLPYAFVAEHAFLDGKRVYVKWSAHNVSGILSGGNRFGGVA